MPQKLVNEGDEEQVWQPEETINFDHNIQTDKVPSAPLSKVNGQPFKAKQEEYVLSEKEMNILQSIAKKLTALMADFNHLFQSLNNTSGVVDNTSGEILAGQTGFTIEGYFDGEQMLASDNQVYEVPTNYASKSKLVEGDSLRLTISPNGQFVYKQIGPVERRRLVATLEQGSDGYYYAVCGEQRWRLLKASVSYFRAEPGDRIAILIPKDKPSQYAALEKLVSE